MIAASVAMIASCQGKGNDVGGDTPGTNSGFYEFPLNVQEDGFEAKDNGVSINVSAIKENNIIFNLIPGAAIKSYRVDVYPKAMLYNLLLNEGCVEGTTAMCEDKIIQLLQNASTSGATVFNSQFDDFSEKEFDWANSEYSGAAQEDRP